MTCNRATIDIDGEGLLARQAVNPDISRTRNRLDDLGDLLGQALQLVEVIAEDFDRQLGAYTGQHFIDTLRNRLVHHNLNTRDVGQRFADIFLDLDLASTRFRIHGNNRVRFIRSRWVSRRFTTTQH